MSKIKIGQIYYGGILSKEYILGASPGAEAILICLGDGCRWGHGGSRENPDNITAEEFEKICGEDNFELIAENFDDYLKMKIDESKGVTTVDIVKIHKEVLKNSRAEIKPGTKFKVPTKEQFLANGKLPIFKGMFRQYQDILEKAENKILTIGLMAAGYSNWCFVKEQGFTHCAWPVQACLDICGPVADATEENIKYKTWDFGAGVNFTSTLKCKCPAKYDGGKHCDWCSLYEGE